MDWWIYLVVGMVVGMCMGYMVGIRRGAAIVGELLAGIMEGFSGIAEVVSSGKEDGSG